MNEENKIETVELKEKTCICQSKGFRNFLVIALGSFVGVFSALTLFAALHKPPMMKAPYGYRGMMRPGIHCNCYHGHHNFAKHRCHRGDLHRKIEKRDFNRQGDLKINQEVKK